jgi:tetratricopeptide (TPR) repeat protein
LDPNFPLAHWFLGLTYEQVARHEEAIAECRKAVTPSFLSARGGLGHAYAVAGKRAEAQQVLAELKELSKQRYVAPFNFALIYAGLGDKAQTFEWLEKTYEDHSLLFSFIKVWPQFDSLRGERRFQDLLRRMGLAP